MASSTAIPRLHAVLLHALLVLHLTQLTTAAQVPAVRAPVGKRALATRLLRSADTHKRQSLHDVLSERPPDIPHVVLTVSRNASFAVSPDLPPRAPHAERAALLRCVRALRAAPPPRQVRALHMLEELCHGIDNGHDLQETGGVAPVVAALKSPHDTVRASAAWALATCSQNNPAVQNASLAAGAVPRLAYLAARDRRVRPKALFALNAVLELDTARLAFEQLPLAIHAVRSALLDESDFRATRRALNLVELLVARNLDPWKTQLEAWDVPVVIERIMSHHPDADVRESAARTVAALDGRIVP